MFIFFQTTDIPLWLKIILALWSIFAPIVSGYFVYILARPKEKVLIEGEKGKNERLQMENYNFSNEVFEKTQTLIAGKNKQIVDLTEELHKVSNTVRLQKLELAKHQGMQELAFQERDKVLQRLEELEDSVKISIQQEKAECDRKITAIQEEMKMQHEQIRLQMEKVQKVFEENNIKFDFDFKFE